MSHIVHFSFAPSQSGQSRPLLAAIRQGKAAIIGRWRDRIALRQMLRELLTQPDSVLADAGWTRATARREAERPVWRATARPLSAPSQQRR